MFDTYTVGPTVVNSVTVTTEEDATSFDLYIRRKNGDITKIFRGQRIDKHSSVKFSFNWSLDIGDELIGQVTADADYVCTLETFSGSMKFNSRIARPEKFPTEQDLIDILGKAGAKPW